MKIKPNKAKAITESFSSEIDSWLQVDKTLIKRHYLKCSGIIQYE